MVVVVVVLMGEVGEVVLLVKLVLVVVAVVVTVVVVAGLVVAAVVVVVVVVPGILLQSWQYQALPLLNLILWRFMKNPVISHFLKMSTLLQEKCPLAGLQLHFG